MVRFALPLTLVFFTTAPVAAQVPADAEPPEPTAVEPAAVEPAAVEPAAVEPTAVEPAAVEPAAVAADVDPTADAEVDEPLLLPEAVDAAEEDAGGSALASPRVDAASAARALRNLDFASAALAHERGSADLEFAVAVNLYVGGVLLSVLSASLIIGTAFEAACINGDISECTDGPAFLIGAIPATIAAVALLFGGATTEARAQAHYRSLDRREREVEDRRRLLPSAGLSIGPASIAVHGRF